MCVNLRRIFTRKRHGPHGPSGTSVSGVHPSDLLKPFGNRDAAEGNNHLRSLDLFSQMVCVHCNIIPDFRLNRVTFPIYFQLI